MATQATQQRQRRAAAQTGLYLLILAAIAVLANWLVATSTVRWDQTSTERYTLSEGSGRLVRSLKEPIKVEAYVPTTSGIARLNAFVRDLKDLLREYQTKSNGKFEFTIIEANTDELRERAKEAGLEPMAFADQKADQASIAQGFMGLVFKYGSERDVIPQLNPSHTEGLEFWITNKIREVRDKAEDIKHRIAVVTGKDELKLSDNNLVARQGRQGSPSMEQIVKQAFPFYSIETVELKESEPIDPKLAGLMITQPAKDYTDKELRRIDEFLMLGGKSLVVVASAVNLKPQDPSMEATLNLHNIDKLLAGYGINIKKNAVLDFGAQFRIPVMTATGMSTIRHPGVLHLYDDPRLEEDKRLLDTGFAAFFRMEELAFPMASEIELLPKKQPKGVELKAVAHTTPQASVVTSDTVDMKLKAQWEPKPPMQQRVVAATAKGKLKSAFPKNEDIKANEQAPTPSRVLVIASSLFLTNPFAYAGNGQEMGGQFQMMGSIGGDRQLQAISQPYAQRYVTNTILCLKNTLDWMTGDSDLIAASAKILSDPNLTYASVAAPDIKPDDDEAALRKKDEEYRKAREQVQNQVQWTLTLGVPILFAGFGVWRWRSRGQARKERRRLGTKRRAA